MTNDLDSRALGQADCYAQRFMRAGDFGYAVVPGHGQSMSTDRPFVIHVGQAKTKAGEDIIQHHVRVEQGNGGPRAVPATLTIGVGDMVIWNGTCSSPFAVVGEAEFFNSYRMVNECGFSHAFGRAGSYEWRDAFGSGLGGVIHVSDPDCQKDPRLKKWQAALADGSVVMIADGKVDRREISIMTGQTVFFAIVKTGGVSITDSRFIDQSWMHPDPCKTKAA